MILNFFNKYFRIWQNHGVSRRHTQNVLMHRGYYFPSYINESLKEAIDAFGKKIKGFDNEDSILAAVESRTSSPVRIERNEEGVSSIDGIYPCGEPSP